MSATWVTCIVLLGAFLVSGCAVEPAQPPPEDAPKLVILIVVDQLGADHLVRFDGVLEGGFRLLLNEGVSFSRAHHAHAKTLTAPGHATLVSGCHPSSHGIVANYWIDRATGEEVYSVDDGHHGRAPSRLECSTLGDWLKDRYPASRVFSLSGKDRSAILMGGHRADGAYWYNWDGTLTSSSYYPESRPTWLAELNDESFLASKFGQAWEPLAFEPERLAAMGVVDYDLGPLEEDFPHAIGGLSMTPGEFYFNDVYESPWMNEYLLRAARAVVTAEQLGRDPYPDLLAIGFSTPDAVGHSHGPDSPEFLDIVVRLDRQLGSFFAWLDETLGLDNVAIALTSDHGSVPVPEMRIEQGLPAGRVGADEISCLQQVDAALDQELGESEWFVSGPYFGRLPVDSPVSPAVLRRRVRSLVEACPSVARVWLAEDLVSEFTGEGSEMQRRFARSYYAERSPDLMVEWEKYFLPSAGNASSHGTAHGYDTHVPLVLRRPGEAAATFETPVMTVDVAPTIADWVAVEVPDGADGRSLVDRLAPVLASGSAP
jgi:predicted AlkP superfamily pyrophosphatase or phosphodiesterase